MKNEYIVLTIILALIASMTGIVAAATTADLKVTDDPITIYVGDTKTQKVTLTLDPVVTDAIKSIEILNLPSGISSKIDGNEGPSLSGPWTSAQSWTVDLTNNGIKNGEYTITYSIIYENSKKAERTTTIQAGISAVPEFPAVALPVGAAIGLLFLFQRRRNKEE